MLQPTHLSSSNIDCIGHKLNTLYIRFKTGISYSYENCPFSYFISLQEVESAGKFFAKQIRGKFHFNKLDHDPFTA